MRLTVWISVWLNQHFESLHLFNVLYAVCVYSLTRCSMLVLPYCRYCIDLLSDNWCPFSTHLSVEIALVCSTRAPLVEPCHTFCVPKHLSALCEKMLVFLQSLPWVLRGGKHREWMVPSAYFPFLVSVLHLMSLPQAWYINCISIIFSSQNHMYVIFLGRITTHTFCQLLNLYWDTLNVKNIIINCMDLNFENDIGKVLAKMTFFFIIFGVGDNMSVRKAKILNHRVPVLS